MAELSSMSGLPVIQVLFSYWKRGEPATSPFADAPNYITLVLPSIVFQVGPSERLR